MEIIWVIATTGIVGGILNVVYSEAIVKLNAKFLKFSKMPQWYIEAVSVPSKIRVAGICFIAIGIGLMVAALLFG